MLPQGYDAAAAAAAAAAGQPQRHTPPSPLDLNQRQPPAVDLGGPMPLQEAAVPSYKLSRQVVTIPDLWREWMVGLGGLPSVAALDAAYGSRWRSHSERQYYSMRKVIIDEIMAMAGNRVDDEEGIATAIQALERQRAQEKWSLDKFIKAIKERRRQRR